MTLPHLSQQSPLDRPTSPRSGVIDLTDDTVEHFPNRIDVVEMLTSLLVVSEAQVHDWRRVRRALSNNEARTAELIDRVLPDRELGYETFGIGGVDAIREESSTRQLQAA